MVTMAISAILTHNGIRATKPPGPCVFLQASAVARGAAEWRWNRLSVLLLLTGTLDPSTEVLPALGLLLPSVRVMPPEASALIDAPPGELVLVDARRDLAHGKSI